MTSHSISSQRFRDLQETTSLSPDDFSLLFNGLLVIVRNLMRQPLHASQAGKCRKELITDLR